VAMKTAPSGSKGKGLSKLPRSVRNKMGYMKGGGMSKKTKGYAKGGMTKKTKGYAKGGMMKKTKGYAKGGKVKR